jgi:hypothetical protein
MIYRKTPPNPPRMLLRIAVPLGASALAGMVVACGAPNPPDGSVAYPPADAGDAGGPIEGMTTGVAVATPDAGDAEAPVHGMTSGTVAVLPDAGDADVVTDAGDAAATIVTGIAPLNDSGVNGVVAHPEDGGFVAGLVVNPGDGG